MMRTRTIIRIHTVILLAACLVACSGFVRLRIAAFEPANADQAAYEWFSRDNLAGENFARLTAPGYQLALQQGDFYWTGSASSGGTLSLRFALEERLPEFADLQVVSAAIVPVRVKKDRHVDLASEYPLQTEAVLREEYRAFWREYRADDRFPRNHEFVPGDLAINAREGNLAARIPFRPRRVKVNLVLENSATQERETLTVIVRERGLRGRL